MHKYLVISNKLNYLIAKCISNNNKQYQVELLDNSATLTIKSSQIIYWLEDIEDIDTFKSQVVALVTQIDIALLCEMLEVDVIYDLNALTSLYFGNDATDLINRTALLFKLASSNIYLRNWQNATFTKYNAIEQQKQREIAHYQAIKAAEYEHYYTWFLAQANAYINKELLDSRLHGNDMEQIDIFKLLHKPEKQSSCYKALQNVAKEFDLNPLNLCHKIGLVPDLAEFFVKCFIKDSNLNLLDSDKKELNQYSNDSAQNTLDTCVRASSIEIHKNDAIRVFSIDDSSTTEIDDAFSLQHTSNGYIVGIHIAAPALDNTLADITAARLSTVYFPGNKIPMLPNHIIDRYSLMEGYPRPVVSIYFNLDQEFNILEFYSRLEEVLISANLRSEELTSLFVLDETNNYQATQEFNQHAYAIELSTLLKFAHTLEEKRGKSSTNILDADFNFMFTNGKISVRRRNRGNPIDKLVSELMILANCTWGRMLTNAFIPAIYRVKQPNYPVTMTLTPQSHTGLNVDYYTWSTSPLRRAVDYINQHQIIAMLNNPKHCYDKLNPTLLKVVETFDTTYSKYLDFQEKMELYWSLQYLLQENIELVTATILYKTTAGCDILPLKFDLSNCTTEQYQRGSSVTLKIYNINVADLTYQFKLIH